MSLSDESFSKIFNFWTIEFEILYIKFGSLGIILYSIYFISLFYMFRQGKLKVFYIVILSF